MIHDITVSRYVHHSSLPLYLYVVVYTFARSLKINKLRKAKSGLEKRLFTKLNLKNLYLTVLTYDMIFIIIFLIDLYIIAAASSIVHLRLWTFL